MAVAWGENKKNIHRFGKKLKSRLTLFAPLSGEPGLAVALEEADLVPAGAAVEARRRAEVVAGVWEAEVFLMVLSSGRHH